MKKTIQAFYILALLTVVVSCKKETDDPESLSSAVFIHASPGTPATQVYIDTLLQSIPTNSSYSMTYSTGLTGATSFTSGYIGLISGTHGVSLENRAGGIRKVFSSFNHNFEENRIYSFFLYDTLNASGEAKVLALTDDLSLPPSGMAKIRFLNLAPNAPALDVTLVRGTAFDTSSTSTQKIHFVGTDSVTITNQSFIGTHPDLEALSRFTHTVAGSSGEGIAKATTIGAVPGLNKDNRYVIKLKAAGTQNVLAQSAPTTLNRDNIYTIFARGTAQGQALGVSVFANYVRF